jgi:hypothetical protein
MLLAGSGDSAANIWALPSAMTGHAVLDIGSVVDVTRFVIRNTGVCVCVCVCMCMCMHVSIGK